MADQPRNNLDASDGVPDDVQALIVRYFDNDLDEAGLVELRETLKHSEAARALFVALSVHSQLLVESLSADYKEEADDVWEDRSDVLTELAALEQQAQASLVSLHDIRKPWHANQWMAGVGALAAVIAIAVVLSFVFAGSGPGASTNPANLATPDQTDDAEAVHVATLTATHNATWAERALARGSALHTGQRLTLTAGVAEITTHRGAVVILQAPASIELLDNDNAIRLHTGKLAGICETPSSKGLLVRTPHTDIIDLGTRFGVDASQPRLTEVHVFEGSVQVSRQPQGIGQAVTRVVAQGEAIQVTTASDRFVDIALAIDRFVMRPSNLLAGTGQSQAEGEIANNWRVVAVDGQPVTQNGGMILVPEHHDGSSDPNTSQWLKINDALNPPGKTSAVFTCRSSVTIPDHLGPATHDIVIRCEADFSVKAVRVNGQPIKVPGNRIGGGWIALAATDHFTAGENTIEVDVHEYFTNNGKANSSSLRVEVESSRR